MRFFFVFLMGLTFLTPSNSFGQNQINKLELKGTTDNGKKFIADFEVAKESFKGTANLVEGKKPQDITVSGYNKDPQPSSITKLNDKEYRVKMDNDVECNLTIVKVEDGAVHCELKSVKEKTNSFEGKFVLRSAQIHRGFDFTLDPSDPGEIQAAWPIWPAVLGVVVVSLSCSYERSAQSYRCAGSAESMANQCDNCTCSWSYTAGWCGGTCDVECN